MHMVDVYVGFPMIRCGASPESRTAVDPWGAHGAWIEEWTVGGYDDVIEGSI